MSYEIKLDLKQAQQLVMTPQLREAISMLQLNNLDLAELVEKELEHNPLLEKDESKQEGEEPQTIDQPDAAEDGSIEQSFDAGSSNASKGTSGSHDFGDSDYMLENTAEPQKDLRTHLMDQLSVSIIEPRDKMIAALMIDRLDESGYLRETPKDIAASLSCSVDRVERLLETLRGFDPTGIFAADLPDCLGLQLIEKNRYDPAMQTLVGNLNLLADAEFSKLKKLCGVDDDDLRDMIDEIRALNPKPAAGFDYVLAQTAIADVLMKPLPKHVGGGWRVELNNETLPRVLINQDYVAILEKQGNDKADKKFLNDKLHSANWLIQAMDQRAQSVLKVASAIIEAQDGFFLFGVEFLKPLTLREIAEEVGVHESTVSRITIDKYIGTPRGLFPLKYFFGSGVSSSGSTGGADMAAEAIKAKIKTLIDNEPANKILSDDALASALQKDGIEIARRTVAKYREAMKIGSSAARRKIKKHQLKT